jgi:sucrose-6-phosphate hydrolase SacC (GH32 family)
MVVSAARKLEIYRSTDLREWFLASSLVLEGTEAHRLYECPDLIQVPVEGTREESIWMMSVSLLKDDRTSAGGPSTPSVPLTAIGSSRTLPPGSWITGMIFTLNSHGPIWMTGGR